MSSAQYNSIKRIISIRSSSKCYLVLVNRIRFNRFLNNTFKRYQYRIRVLTEERKTSNRKIEGLQGFRQTGMRYHPVFYMLLILVVFLCMAYYATQILNPLTVVIPISSNTESILPLPCRWSLVSSVTICIITIGVLS